MNRLLTSLRCLFAVSAKALEMFAAGPESSKFAAAGKKARVLMAADRVSLSWKPDEVLCSTKHC